MSSLPAVQQMLIEEFGLTSDQVHGDALLEPLGIDSLATIEFMFMLEDRFKLDMPESQAQVRTVGDIAREVDALIQKRDTAG